MTDKQLKQKEAELSAEIARIGYGWTDGGWVQPPTEYELRLRELSCIYMINSILAYQGAGMTDAEAVMQMEENSYHNYLAEYVDVLGREKVVALIQAQIDDIDYVQRNVYTDCEGCSYNSIVWKGVA